MDNRSVADAPLEYSRVNLSSDPIYRYLRITKSGPGGVPGEAAEQDLLDGAWLNVYVVSTSCKAPGGCSPPRSTLASSTRWAPCIWQGSGRVIFTRR